MISLVQRPDRDRRWTPSRYPSTYRARSNRSIRLANPMVATVPPDLGDDLV